MPNIHWGEFTRTKSAKPSEVLGGSMALVLHIPVPDKQDVRDYLAAQYDGPSLVPSITPAEELQLVAGEVYEVSAGLPITVGIDKSQFRADLLSQAQDLWREARLELADRMHLVGTTDSEA